MRNVKINESGHIVVKNLSAWWIPEIKVEREIHGTIYTVTGSFEGNELLEKNGWCSDATDCKAYRRRQI